MNLVVWTNIALGFILAISSAYYKRKVGGSWRTTGACLVGIWISFTYLARVFLVPEFISHGFWGNWMVRPAFTLILILMTAKAVYAVKRAKVYGLDN